MTNRPASIKTIAKTLGISHMTVSRALRGEANVSLKTMAAVRACAEELGYVGSAAARAMRGSATPIVGLLLPNLENEFYARLASALEGHCADAGMNLVIHLTSDDASREAVAISRLEALQAANVILVPAPGGTSMIGEKSPMQVIELIRTGFGERVACSVMLNETDAIYRATTHLLSQGHRRLAYIGASDNFSSGRMREAGHSAALKSFSIDRDASLLFLDTPSYRHGYNTLSTLIAAPNRPTAVVCGGFEVTRGALDRALEEGLRFPEDLAFIGYGDPSHFRWLAGGITSLSPPIGKIAKAMAIRLKDDGTNTRADCTLDIEFNIRKSSTLRLV